MKYYGTKNNRDYGFYEENFENAIEITDEYWLQLLEDQNNGKTITLIDNMVTTIDEKEYSLIDGAWKKLTDEESKIKQLNIQNAIRIKEIQEELDSIDKKRIRAIAEPSLKDENTTWLEHYNKQIKALRDELSQINN